LTAGREVNIRVSIFIPPPLVGGGDLLPQLSKGICETRYQYSVPDVPLKSIECFP
jgi:hypothetical protein